LIHRYIADAATQEWSMMSPHGHPQGDPWRPR
jgi:hypothetical protein